MAEYTTTFLVLNLGSEMIYVIAQRLAAQGVTSARASIVLEEIIYNLIAPDFFLEISQPQPILNEDAVKLIIGDVAQSSVMKMDSTSLTRLWDLITMVFKWQMSLSEEPIKITQRHLYELETYTLTEKTQMQLHRVQNTIENFDNIFTKKEKKHLRFKIFEWLEPFNAKIAILLNLGLQSVNGDFIANNISPIALDMVKNLGENIYSINHNEGTSRQGGTPNSSNELQVFADQILGNRKLSSTSTDSGPSMKLLIDNQERNEDVVDSYDKIDVEVKNSNLERIFSDLNVEEQKEDEEEKDLFDCVEKQQE